MRESFDEGNESQGETKLQVFLEVSAKGFAVESVEDFEVGSSPDVKRKGS